MPFKFAIRCSLNASREAVTAKKSPPARFYILHPGIPGGNHETWNLNRHNRHIRRGTTKTITSHQNKKQIKHSKTKNIQRTQQRTRETFNETRVCFGTVPQPNVTKHTVFLEGTGKRELGLRGTSNIDCNTCKPGRIRKVYIPRSYTRTAIQYLVHHSSQMIWHMMYNNNQLSNTRDIRQRLSETVHTGL